MSLRATILLSSAAALGALGIVFLGCCSRLNFLFFFGSMFLWLFAFPLSAVTLALIWWKARAWKRTITLLAVWCVFCVGTFPAVLAGSFVLGKRVELSKLRAERVALRLELFHEKHGRYPADLDELAKEGWSVRVPPLAPRPGFYTRRDDEPGYELNVDDPAGLFSGGWTWYSTEGKWQYWD
jgi:hypothetical protein